MPKEKETSVEETLSNLIRTINQLVERIPAPAPQSTQTGSVIQSILQNLSGNFDSFNDEIETIQNYLDRLTNFCRLKGLTGTDEETLSAKVSLLINFLGPKYFELLSNLTSPDSPSSKTYAELTTLLIDHLSPKKNVLTEQHLFLSRTQKDGESISEFVTALKRMFKTAEFKCSCTGEPAHCRSTIKNLVLRAQFIRGLNDAEIREKILQSKEISFDDCYQMAIAIEASKIDTREAYRCSSTSNVNRVTFQKSKGRKSQRLSSRSSSTRRDRNPTSTPPLLSHRGRLDLSRYGLDGICLCCSSKSHSSRECPRKHKLKCTECLKSGHISRVCIKSRLRRSVSNVNQIEQLEDGQSECSESTYNSQCSSSHSHGSFGYLNHIREVHSIRDGDDDRMMLNVRIEGKSVSMEADSGSRYSLMSIADFKRLGLNRPLSNTSVVLKSYTGHTFQPIGCAKVKTQYLNKSIIGGLYIVAFDTEPVLGRQWLRALQIIPEPVHKLSTLHKKLPTSVPKDAKEAENQLKLEFQDVFKEEVGEVPNYKISLKFKDTVRPVFLKPRTVPYSLKPLVEEELQKLEDQGIIQKTPFSEWGTPLVVIPKPNGQVRICADYKVTINPQLIDARYPIPIIDEMFSKLEGGKIFCTFDVHKAFLNLAVDEKSAAALALSTHLGTYQVKRLFFGIKVAPNEFQKFMDEMIADLPGVFSYFDDLIVKGRTLQECWGNSRRLLEKLRKFNLHLNPSKSKFFQQKLTYLGHTISSKGLQKSHQKVAAILDAPPPRNSDEVRQFLGLVNYYKKFLPDAATILHPLNLLLHKNVKFVWTSKCQDAFQRVKAEIASDRILTSFSPNLPLILATDASPYGLSGVLSHVFPNGDEKPITFISRTLTPAEKNYSQLDKEATAVYWSCKRLFDYLYGRHFTLCVDNKPICSILHPEKKLPAVSATRLLRYAHFLSNFTYTIQHRSGKDHTNADYFSRNPVMGKSLDKTVEPDEIDVLLDDTIHHISDASVTSVEIASETRNDPELSALLADLQSGKVRDPQYSVREAVIFRGERVVIPRSLRQYVLNELHSTHVGIVRMKALARNYCYWTGIDKEIEDMVKSCRACCEVKSDCPRAPLHAWEVPNEPWQRLHMDYAGPFMNHHFFIVVDAKTKWPEAFVLKQAPSSTSTMTFLDELFCRMGYPQILVSDNATIFRSSEFKRYCTTRGIRQRFSPPGHPATNGQAERYCQTIKRKLKCIATNNMKDLQGKLQELLFRYRATPSADGKSPAQKMFGRNLRTRLDLFKPSQLDEGKKNQGYSPASYEIGERVQSRNYTGNKLWKFGKIIKRLGSLIYLVELDDGYMLKRHYNQLRPCQVERATELPEIVLPNDTSNPPNDTSNGRPNIADPTGNGASGTVTVNRRSSIGSHAKRSSLMMDQPTPKISAAQPPIEELAGAAESTELRRSSRARAPPIRLGVSS